MSVHRSGKYAAWVRARLGSLFPSCKRQAVNGLVYARGSQAPSEPRPPGSGCPTISLRSAGVLLLAARLAAQSPVLEIKVIEGEGASHGAGTRVFSALRIRVADSLGNAVPGAIVTFRLPDEGPSGQFANGLNTEIVATGAEGEARTPSIRWNEVPGAFYVRIAAVKGEARAGTAVALSLSSGQSAAAPARSTAVKGPPPAAMRSKLRWRWVALGAAAGAAAALAAGRAANASSQAAAPQPVRIGLPSIAIGKP